MSRRQPPRGRKSPDQPPRFRPDRREFLKLSALTAAAAGLHPRMTWGALLDGTRPAANTLPGRIVIYRDAGMNGHMASIDANRVEQVLHRSIQILAGIDETGPAFASLLPGITASSRIAIKVNCIGPTDTRWETARGVVSGLSLMLGGTYDVSNVTVFDNQYIFGHGYAAANFTFNGHTAVLSSSNSPSSYYVYPGYRLSSHLMNAQFVIDMPALKSHSDGNNQITVALKNHYGSCSPSSLCGNIPGMLTVNADANIKGKTCLVVLDGIRGTYTGGPGEAPQSWNLYPEHSPNTLFVSTDPITTDYWARDTINDERQLRGLSAKPCPWIEQGSGSPYNLGVSNPGQMTVLTFDAAEAGEQPDPAAGVFLSPAMPNPFREGTVLRFHLVRPGPASIVIVDAAGRVLRRYAREFPAGHSQVAWDGRDGRGQRVASGVYLARLEVADSLHIRKVIAAR